MNSHTLNNYTKLYVLHYVADVDVSLFQYVY